MKNDLIKKLTSRKFIVTAISAIAGIITMIIGDNAVVDLVASALMVVIPTIVYCIMEGVIDAKSVKTITETVVDTAEKLGASEEVVDTLEKVGEIGEVLVKESTEE